MFRNQRSITEMARQNTPPAIRNDHDLRILRGVDDDEWSMVATEEPLSVRRPTSPFAAQQFSLSGTVLQGHVPTYGVQTRSLYDKVLKERIAYSVLR